MRSSVARHRMASAVRVRGTEGDKSESRRRSAEVTCELVSRNTVAAVVADVASDGSLGVAPKTNANSEVAVGTKVDLLRRDIAVHVLLKGTPGCIAAWQDSGAAEPRRGTFPTIEVV